MDVSEPAKICPAWESDSYQNMPCLGVAFLLTDLSSAPSFFSWPPLYHQNHGQVACKSRSAVRASVAASAR